MPSQQRASRRHHIYTGGKRIPLKKFVWPTVLALSVFVFVLFSISQRLPDVTSVEEELLSSVPSKTFCARGKPPVVCAHGGDTTKARSNTRAAFAAAVDSKVDCVEIDVSRTKDDQLVVLHIRELNELLGKSRGMQVGDMPWSELQLLKWPGGTESVMLVEDAVRLTSPFFTTVILDIKTYQDEKGRPMDEDAMVKLVTLLVHRTGCSNCLVWAKSDRIVRGVKDISPGQRVGLVMMNNSVEARAMGMQDPLRMEEPEVVAGHYLMADPPLIASLRAHHKTLFVWTVNNPVAMREMLDVGVDGIVTNQPRLVQSAVEQRLRACDAVLYGIQRHDET